MTPTSNPTAHAHADAWAFVLRHQGMIRAFCARWFGGLSPLDREEAEAAVLVRIVERYPYLRLTGARNPKAVISTWIGFQVRATLTTAMRSRRKVERAGIGRLVEVGGAVAVSTGSSDGEVIGTPVPAPPGQEPDRRVVDRDLLAQVEAIWYVADERQRLAIQSHLDGDDVRRARERGFRTLRERNAVLLSLQPAAEA